MNHEDCPVCRGKVTKENVTPIYGAGDEEKDPRKTEKHDRPKAHYEESDHSVSHVPLLHSIEKRTESVQLLWVSWFWSSRFLQCKLRKQFLLVWRKPLFPFISTVFLV